MVTVAPPPAGRSEECTTPPSVVRRAGVRARPGPRGVRRSISREIRARIYCSASVASAISASAAMIAKPRARKMLPADATTLVVPTTGAIPIMIA
jgi:hypothetical protein